MSNILMDILEKCSTGEIKDNRYDSCLVKIGGKIYLTNRDGKIVERAVWNTVPFIESNLFFRNGKEIWGLNGERLEWAGDSLVWFSHMWLCSTVYGKKFVGRVKQFGDKFIVDDNLMIDDFGYCDYNSVVYKKDGLWRRSLYAGGYIDSSAPVSLGDASQVDMVHGGARASFIAEIGGSGGISTEQDELQVYRRGASAAFKVLSECLEGKIPEYISPLYKVPLDIVQLCIDCIGTRKSYLSEIVMEG